LGKIHGGFIQQQPGLLDQRAFLLECITGQGCGKAAIPRENPGVKDALADVFDRSVEIR